MYFYWNLEEYINYSRTIFFTWSPTSSTSYFILMLPEVYLFFAFCFTFLFVLLYSIKKSLKLYHNLVACFSMLLFLILLNTIMLYYNMMWNILSSSSISYFSSGTNFFKIFLILLFSIYLYKLKEYELRFEACIYLFINFLSLLYLISVTTFLSFFLCVELFSFSIYILIVYKQNSIYAIEAGLKYFILSSIISCWLLFSFCIIYFLYGISTFNDYNYFFLTPNCIIIESLNFLTDVLFFYSDFNLMNYMNNQNMPFPLISWNKLIPKLPQLNFDDSLESLKTQIFLKKNYRYHDPLLGSVKLDLNIPLEYLKLDPSLPLDYFKFGPTIPWGFFRLDPNIPWEYLKFEPTRPLKDSELTLDFPLEYLKSEYLKPNRNLEYLDSPSNLRVPLKFLRFEPTLTLEDLESYLNNPSENSEMNTNRPLKFIKPYRNLKNLTPPSDFDPSVECLPGNPKLSWDYFKLDPTTSRIPRKDFKLMTFEDLKLMSPEELKLISPTTSRIPRENLKLSPNTPLKVINLGVRDTNINTICEVYPSDLNNSFFFKNNSSLFKISLTDLLYIIKQAHSERKYNQINFSLVNLKQFPIVTECVSLKNSLFSYEYNNYYYWNFLCITLILLYIAFKLSAAPFHIWSVDIYMGINYSLFFYLVLIPKLVLLFLFIKLCYIYFNLYVLLWSTISLILGLCSILIGACGAIFQIKIKKFWIYSTINNLGFLFLIITQLSFFSILTFSLYIFIYFLVMISFMVIFTNEGYFTNTLLKNTTFTSWEICIKQSYLYMPLSCALGILLFSIGGLPPLAGFLNKFFFYQTLWFTSNQYIIYLVLCSTIISIFYYFRIIKYLFFTNSFNWVYLKPLSNINSLIISNIIFFQIFIFFNSNFYIKVWEKFFFNFYFLL